MKFTLRGLLLLVFFTSTLFATAQYKLLQSKSSIIIYGTSNVHDWEENCEEIVGVLEVELDGNTIKRVIKAQITIPVQSIKSGKSGMDDNTYKALKSKKYPNISYNIKSFGVSGDVIHLTGNLTIAGVTKEIKFKASYKVDGNSVTFKGNYKFKMSDFKIDPPTAVFGTIKTGDEIDLKFDLTFSM